MELKKAGLKKSRSVTSKYVGLVRFKVLQSKLTPSQVDSVWLTEAAVRDENEGGRT